MLTARRSQCFLSSLDRENVDRSREYCVEGNWLGLGWFAELGSESNDSRLSRQNASVLFCCCISELNDRQTRNAPEVARIDRQHGVAERERGRTDKEIGEWTTIPRLCCSASSLPASLACPWSMEDRDGGKKLLDESFTARPASGAVSTVNSVDEFDAPTGDNAASWSPAVSMTRGRRLEQCHRPARPQSRHSNRELVPRRRRERFAVAADDGLKERPEVARCFSLRHANRGLAHQLQL